MALVAMTNALHITDVIADLNRLGITPYKLVQMVNERGLRFQLTQLQRVMTGGRCDYRIADAIREIHEFVSRETLRT